MLKELPEPITRRLQACLDQLRAAYAGGSPMSSASKGMERELFVEVFLKNVMPPAYRFGSGDVVDAKGNTSGQVDIVIESLTVPSFPLVGVALPRLYLAEGVGAAIEVKSDLASQWEEAVGTAERLSRLQPQIQPIVVGYRGWAKWETLATRIDAAPHFAGCLTLDPPRYLGRIMELRPGRPLPPPDIGLPGVPTPPPPLEPHQRTFYLEGPAALWGFVYQLCIEVSERLNANLGGYSSLPEPVWGDE